MLEYRVREELSDNVAYIWQSSEMKSSLWLHYKQLFNSVLYLSFLFLLKLCLDVYILQL